MDLNPLFYTSILSPDPALKQVSFWYSREKLRINDISARLRIVENVQHPSQHRVNKVKHCYFRPAWVEEMPEVEESVRKCRNDKEVKTVRKCKTCSSVEQKQAYS